MPYKPKYCCQCGEKIDRVDWKPWTSRRFCDLCATEFGVFDQMRGILLGIALLFGLYGIGSYFQKPDRKLTVVPSQFAVSNQKSDTGQVKNAAQVATNSGVQLTAHTNNSVLQTKATPTSNLKTEQLIRQTVESPEKAYFCGAQTKKGTMCSRRVKNGGRCWQHEGHVALLPQEKLIAAK